MRKERTKRRRMKEKKKRAKCKKKKEGNEMEKRTTEMKATKGPTRKLGMAAVDGYRTQKQMIMGQSKIILSYLTTFVQAEILDSEEKNLSLGTELTDLPSSLE
jgi:hypothetical protein